MDERKIASLFKALGDENRIRILNCFETAKNVPAVFWKR